MSVSELVKNVSELNDEEQMAFFEQSLGQLSILTVSKLVKHLEKVWDVEAAPNFGGIVNPELETEEEAEEQTQFAVVVTNCGSNRIKIVRAVKDKLDGNLKEINELLKSLPAEVKSGLSKEDADRFKTDLESLGATVELK